MTLTTDFPAGLIRSAIMARQNAYAPYSQYRVGAAVLTDDGTIISGCNVENASYGNTLCAERVAVSAAVTRGYRQFRAIAVATRGGGSPCGSCRQVLVEFCRELPIWIVAVDDGANDAIGEASSMSLNDLGDRLKYRCINLSDLLPEAFTGQSLE